MIARLAGIIARATKTNRRTSKSDCYSNRSGVGNLEQWEEINEQHGHKALSGPIWRTRHLPTNGLQAGSATLLINYSMNALSIRFVWKLNLCFFFRSCWHGKVLAMITMLPHCGVKAKLASTFWTLVVSYNSRRLAAVGSRYPAIKTVSFASSLGKLVRQ